jgi:hypothetical protein
MGEIIARGEISEEECYAMRLGIHVLPDAMLVPILVLHIDIATPNQKGV